MSDFSDRAQDVWRRVKPYVVRFWNAARKHVAALVGAVRQHFKPSENAIGWRAVSSRFSNLWLSGRYGKEVLLISGCLLLFWMKGLLSDEDLKEDSDSDVPAIQTWSDHPRSNSSGIYEEEPYGLMGSKFARVCSRARDGRPIYAKLPALSMVKGPFIVDTSIGTPYMIGDPSSEARHRRLVERSRTEFPAASDKKGRLRACKEMAEKQAAGMAIGNAYRRLNESLAPIDEELARNARNSLAEFESREKGRQIQERQHDYEMAKALGMPIRQYDTYKNTRDAINLDREGYYRGADGKLGQIDYDGNKWWIQNGVRGEAH